MEHIGRALFGSGLVRVRDNPWDICSTGLLLWRDSMSNEKQKVALSSVLAAVFLTSIKIIVGIFTGSLGVLSEAAHSTLDLGAALVTLFAVKISDKPADKDHNYGHGKIESFSALIETLLLLLTCIWIINEAMQKLFFGKSLEVSGSFWGIAIMAISIIVDVSRSRALKKVAKKYGSQALEADALHFSSDIASSSVVIAGLICVEIGNYFKIHFLDYGDPIAALGVSLLVIIVSIRLGKRTVDVLLDTAPKGMESSILHEVNSVKGVLDVSGVRIRPSGAKLFIDLNIGINRNESHRVVHSIVDEVREKIRNQLPDSDVVISTYPVTVGNEDQEVYRLVKKVVDRFPNCTNIHNIHIYEVCGKKYIAIHLEVKEMMNLRESHELSHTIGGLIQQDLSDVEDVSVNFEHVKEQQIMAQDITAESQGLIHKIDSLLNNSEQLNCHDIRIYSFGDKLTLFLHCAVNEDYELDRIEVISKDISNRVKNNIANVENIHVHLEPMNN
jgi:cation diffusion facilitator family transporter